MSTRSPAKLRGRDPTGLPVGTRKVLVTGGGSGIGRAVAELLLERGAKVVVLGRRRERLEELASAWPGQAEALVADLGAGTKGVLARAREILGGLDGLVCAAGVSHHELPGGISETALREQIEVNLVAPLRLAEEALGLLEPGGGVVFVASNLAHRPIETSAVYSASKAGLLAAMRAFAAAGATRRIRLNAVSPGIVDTEMIRVLRLEKKEPPHSEEEAARRLDLQLEALRREVPLGRLGSPAEIAEAVVHLLGAPWISGSDWLIDGGGLLR